MVKINQKFVPIKLHYFLRFAATSSLGLFLPLIVLQKGVPPQGIGLLWTALPFIALLVNSSAGGIADAFKIHKPMFLFALVLLTSGSAAIYFLPPVEGSKLQGTEVPTEISQTGSHVEEDGQNAEASTSLSEFSNATYIVRAKLLRSSSSIQAVKDSGMSLGDILKLSSFWLVFGCVLMQHVGLNMTIIFTDAACFKILGPDHEKYGNQRMWGTIGMGLFSVVIGGLVDWHSKGLPEKDYMPAFVICFVLMILDIILVSRMTVPYSKAESLKCAVLGNTLLSLRSVIFLLTVIVYGFTLGMNWTFRLMLVEDVAREYNPEFGAVKLLQGILMFVETFGGELPFLFLSGKIIHRLGHEIVFLLCLLSVCLRYFLYYILPNPWMFLPVEILNGPAYGLMHANMVAYGTFIAPPGALATVHAIIRACISAGQASGGLVGGILYHRVGGRLTFLLTSLIVLAFSFLFGTMQALFRCKTLENVCKGKSGIKGSEV